MSLAGFDVSDAHDLQRAGSRAWPPKPLHDHAGVRARGVDRRARPHRELATRGHVAHVHAGHARAVAHGLDRLDVVREHRAGSIRGRGERERQPIGLRPSGSRTTERRR